MTPPESGSRADAVPETAHDAGRPGSLFISAGGLHCRIWRFWIPDGLHLWWKSRGVHLFWSSWPPVEFDRWEDWRGDHERDSATARVEP
jgi:hypothetical protein